VDEVRYYVQDFTDSLIKTAVDGGVIKSYGSVNSLLDADLQRVVASLKEDCFLNRTSSTQQTVDLVDPYLFPFTWEKTKVLPSRPVHRTDCISRCGDGLFVVTLSSKKCAQDDFAKYRNDMSWSRRYQWLPFDIVLGEKGEGPQ